MFIVVLITIGMILILLPYRIQSLVIWLSDHNGVLSRFATNYVRTQEYIWHLRFCGLIALLMGIIQISAV